MATEKYSNAGAMPELTDYAISYSALTEHVLLRAKYTDTMASVPSWPTVHFPDQTICLSRRQAENLIRELKKAVDYIDAGIEHPSIKFID
ncbi:hypothetical protein [Enterobacter wuhouensis]|uniref:hypothetical protein n=1 Tax=Enterobacter wuhouensis TaxID=2529381 RepID=UPI00352384B0